MQSRGRGGGADADAPGGANEELIRGSGSESCRLRIRPDKCATMIGLRRAASGKRIVAGSRGTLHRGGGEAAGGRTTHRGGVKAAGGGWTHRGGAEAAGG